FKYIGEDNVLWGTDSIWYGSPQDQIQAFRTFQISEALREKFGYPTMTPKLRAKVFGLNATKPYRLAADELSRFTAKDKVAQSRAEYSQSPNPSYATYGPRTRREFLNLRAWHAGEP
ncbi:MAG: amidohydrolase, partial [Steroidobacteraceae bacterium]|nr:amidohydrolase [Steroidobacteraceae bacterium]